MPLWCILGWSALGPNSDLMGVDQKMFYPEASLFSGEVVKDVDLKKNAQHESCEFKFFSGSY